MSSLSLHGVTVVRGRRRLLDDLTITVDDGERLAVLGPSGSGKSVLLRTVAGVEELAAGQIVLGGDDVTHLPARDRDVAMVDQQASLLPHLDVAENLAFPLRLRGLPEDEIDKRVRAESNAFSLRHLLARYPGTLSRGERHEVALARSLLRRTSLLLVDEPFLPADPPRRAHMLRELSVIQSGYGTTLVLATNDQRIAMSLADRILVLDRGRVVQLGPPHELFDRPANVFIATHVGEPPMNLIEGVLRRSGRRTRIEAGAFSIPSWSLLLSSMPPQPVVVGIRPRDLLLDPPEHQFVVPAVVEQRTFLGDTMEVTLVVGEEARLSARWPRPAPELGEVVRLGLRPEGLHVFDGDGRAITHAV